MMGWIEWVAWSFMLLVNVLTWWGIARTLKELRSSPTRPPLPPAPGSEPGSDLEDVPRVWADDVLAEEEVRERKTQGAAAHSFDVCTYWDEEDERQAAAEQAARVSRSMRSP